MCIEDVGDSLERELRSRNTNELRYDKTDGGKHGLTAVFEFGFTEPADPFGCPLLLCFWEEREKIAG